jgi:thiamine transport system permease protein
MTLWRVDRQPSLIAGALALAAIVAVMAGALVALALTALTLPGDGRPVIDAYFWRVVRFTLLQAALSTVLSLGFALPVARALARRPQFPGRRAILNLFALPLALPALVVVLGVVGLWGRQGWINQALGAFGLETGLDIYGLQGILIAHVFFNMPLSARLMVAHLDRIPGESWRLASQLGMTSSALFRLIEWPVLRAGLPGIAALVFMLCVASFTVVLTLGGGPAATTIEVAIYQALRFEFDPGRAVVLALVQLAFTAVFITAIGRFALPLTVGPDLARAGMRPDTAALVGRIGDTALIVLATLFLVLPLVSVALDSVAAPLARLMGEPVVRRALATSLGIASVAAVLAIGLTWALVQAARAARMRARGRPLLEWFASACDTGGSLILVMPPIVIGAGWFVLLRPVADIFALAPILVIVINALMAIPYATRILGPAVAEAAQAHDRLCASLGISGWNRLRRIDWPALKRPLGLALAFAMALSLGDLGVIALFGSEQVLTLPLLLLQRMGSYRTADAAGLAGLLALLCLGLIWTADALFGRARR